MRKTPEISSLIDKAIFDFDMIRAGDRILVGASGGKDSTALVEYFASRAKRPSANFSFMAAHIQSDFAPPFPAQIKSLFDEWRVPFATIQVDVAARVKAGRKMNCWWCSTQRRKELLDFALKNGFNKIALGHHLDDILETLLMNVFSSGTLETMLPFFDYKKYSVSLIRPLCYVSAARLSSRANEKGWAAVTCECDWQRDSARKEARESLLALTRGDETKKEKLFRAILKTWR